MIQANVIERERHVLDVLTNNDDTVRIMISRQGAELVSLARREVDGSWMGFLYRDGDVTKNPQGWNNHATVMGYYIHRILNETTSYRGHKIQGGTHSFLRHKRFPEPKIESNRLTYQLSANQIDQEEYPFRVDFSLAYELTAEELIVIFGFNNQENFPAHVSFGLHPGFAVSSLAAAEVILPPGKYIRHLAPENFLSGETLLLDFAGGPMPFQKSELPGSFLLELVDVPKRIFTVGDSLRRTTLDFFEAPYLTLWSNGDSFICVEPCWGLPDHHAQRPFEEKSGIQIVPPLGTLQRRFTLRPEILTKK